MDLIETLVGRRTVYRFTDSAVPQDVIERALDVARWAPVHKLTEPWRFVVVGPKTRAALGPIAERLARAKAEKEAVVLSDDALAALLEKQVQKVVGLPALIAVTSQLSPNDPFREREDYAATACALHNLVLSLWADGVAAQWGTGGIIRDDETYAVLGIDRAEAEIIGFVKIGYPEKVPSQRRKAVDDVTRRLP